MSTVNPWLIEQLKTVKNLCSVGELLITTGNDYLLPTILEIMKIEVDDIVFENCVKEE